MADALADDFNTPLAIRILQELVAAVNAYTGSQPAPNSFVVRSAASFVQSMMKVRRCFADFAGGADRRPAGVWPGRRRRARLCVGRVDAGGGRDCAGAGRHDRLPRRCP
jgi:hypothetical protein